MFPMRVRLPIRWLGFLRSTEDSTVYPLALHKRAFILAKNWTGCFDFSAEAGQGSEALAVRRGGVRGLENRQFA